MLEGLLGADVVNSSELPKPSMSEPVLKAFAGKFRNRLGFFSEHAGVARMAWRPHPR